jgi:hypothetical protein
MNNLRALDRCHSRAPRLAKVKFVALPMEMDLEPEYRSGNRTNPATGLFTSLHALLIRVIGRF